MTLLVLGLLTLFFLQSGSTFLAFLTLIVALLLAVSSTTRPASGAVYGPPNPYVIQQQPTMWPAKTKFEIRPNYPGDPDGDEWISGKAGQWVLLFGLAIKKLFGLGKGKGH